MKKEFIDYMYEQRASIQLDINRLVLESKQVTYQCCDNMPFQSETHAELRTRRSQIEGVNKTIEMYLKTHTRDI